MRWLRTLPSRLPSPASLLRDTALLFGGRHMWDSGGRLHIEVRGVEEAGPELESRVVAACGAVDGVDWAAFNALTGHLVAKTTGDVDVLELVRAIEDAERETAVQPRRVGHASQRFPAHRTPLVRAVAAIAGDVVALPLAVAGAATRVVLLPIEVPALLSHVDAAPPIRRVMHATIGPDLAEVTVSLLTAATQALAAGPVGLTVDLARRTGQVIESRSRADAFAARERHLNEPDDWHSPWIARPARPQPLPPGPIEQYNRAAMTAAVSAGAVSGAVTQSVTSGRAALLAALPKAAHLGREAFAAECTRSFARRAIVVLEPDVLRTLDRIDTVVVDDATLGDRPELDGVVEAAEAAGHELVFTTDTEVAYDTVIRLQQDGRVVALLSTTDDAALRAADCGVAVSTYDLAPRWSADILCGTDLDDAAMVIDATRVARELSGRLVQVAAGGSAAAALAAMVAPGRAAPRAAADVSNMVAFGTMTYGAWRALRLGDRPLPVRIDTTPWHALDVDQTLQQLRSNRAGLAPDEAPRRKRATPANDAPDRNLADLVLQELANPLTPVLGIGAGVSAAVGSIVDATLVGLVVVSNALLGAGQRVRTDNALLHLEETSSVSAQVTRNGDLVELREDELVVGDVLHLEPGEVVAADARLMDADRLQVDESSLTGESQPADKSPEPVEADLLADRRSMLYRGTTVLAGAGDAVVVHSGEQTEAEVAARLAAKRDDRPGGVERRLEELTRKTLPAVAVSGGALIANGVLRGRPLREALGAGVGLAVAAVPEGLPVVASIAELASARRLSQRGALIREPKTIEALGRVSVLCFDKTGTLTEGQVRLRRVSDGTDYWPVDELPDRGRNILAHAMRATPRTNGNDAHATDRAVLEAAEQAGLGEPPDATVGDLPFTSERTYHAVRLEDPADPAHVELFVKGAPEVILERCRSWRRESERLTIGEAERSELEDAIHRLASDGYRVLAVATRDDSRSAELVDDDVDDLEFHGFLAMADSVRPSARAATEQLRAAGVGLVMITGDHPETARAIAADLGILNGHEVVTGTELDDLDDDELTALVTDAAVFARVSPTHKVRIVDAYRRAGEVVAMTGDGVNDAPAIRRADVGIALGKSGTEAARRAAEVVVSDDHIETIVDAIIEGRAMWISVRDALAVLLGGNLGEIAFTLIGSAPDGRSPLNPRQIMLVNLMTDLLPAAAIAMRPPSNVTADQLLREGPDQSLRGALNTEIVVRATATTAAATLAFWGARVSGRRTRANTIGFSALVGAQLAQTVIGGGANRTVVLTSALSAAALVAIVQTPGVSQFFGCTPLGPVAWGIVGASISSTAVASWLVPPTVRRVTAHLASGQLDTIDEARGLTPVEARS